MQIGQVIRKIRNNKSITQQALADAIGMTRPYIARIESGKNSISSDKLTEVLDFCNVTYNEFFYMKNEYKINPKMELHNKVINLYYANDINGIIKIQSEIKKKYEENGDVFLKQLYILCHCIENKFDPKKINNEYISEIADYLLSVDEWCYHELVILNNFVILFPPATAMLMTKNLLYRADKYKDLNSDGKLLSFLLVNLLELSIKYNEYHYSRKLLETTKKYFTESTNYFEKTLILFYEGMLNIVDKSVTEGIEKCNRAFTVFNALGEEKVYEKYKKDMEDLLNKQKLSID